MTLVELLVVITIMSILVGMGLPLMKTSLESGRLRETSRMLNTQFSVAKALAVETGRPAGAWFEVESLAGTNPLVRYATRVFLAETPPPYSGDVVDATMNVSSSATNDTYYDYYTATYDAQSASLPTLVKDSEGDEIRFDFKGPFYTIVPNPSPSLPNQIKFRGVRNRDPAPPATVLRYQIHRQPQKSSASAVVLPKGTVIDLMNSGYGLAGTEGATANKYVCVVFGPGGDVERVITMDNAATPQPLIVYPTQTLHLLVGSIDKLPDPSGTPNPNLVDNSNLWVSVAPQTGRVTTVENAWLAGGTIADARQFAQSSQAKGGR